MSSVAEMDAAPDPYLQQFIHGRAVDEPDRRLELLHDNVKKYGTVFNTVAPGNTPARWICPKGPSARRPGGGRTVAWSYGFAAG